MNKKRFTFKALLLPFLLILSGCSVGGSKTKIPNEIKIEKTLEGIEKLEFLLKVKEKSSELNKYEMNSIYEEYDENFNEKPTLASETKATYNIYENAVLAKTNSKQIETKSGITRTRSSKSENIDIEGDGVVYQISTHYDYLGRTIKNTLQTPLPEGKDIYDYYYGKHLSGYFRLDPSFYTVVKASDGFYYAYNVYESKKFTGTYNSYDFSRTISKISKDYKTLANINEYDYRYSSTDQLIEDYNDIAKYEYGKTEITFHYGKKATYKNAGALIEDYPMFNFSPTSAFARTYFYNVAKDEDGKLALDAMSGTKFEDGELIEAVKEDNGILTNTYQFTNVAPASLKAMRIEVDASTTSYGFEEGKLKNNNKRLKGFVDFSNVYKDVTNLPENIEFVNDEAIDDVYLVNVSEETYKPQLALEISIKFIPSFEDGWKMTSVMFQATEIKFFTF